MRSIVFVALPLLVGLGCTGAGDGEGTDGPARPVRDDTGREGTPDIAVDPVALDLGATTPGGVLLGSFALTNSGNAPLDASLALADDAGVFAIDTRAVTLAPGDARTVNARFGADALGAYTATVAITSDDPDEGLVIVTLTAAASGAIDVDGDGYAPDDGDCDDGDAAVGPGAPELGWNGRDDDCDGATDEQAAAAEAAWTVIGPGAGDGIGGALEIGADLDRDGADELLIGAAGLDHGSRNADVGALAFASAADAAPRAALHASTLELFGDSRDDALGQAFVVLDERDGDGGVLLAVSAPLDDANGADDGSVYLLDVAGLTGAYTASARARGELRGVSSNAHVGAALAAGDVDGDGVLELAASGPDAQGGRGTVYLAAPDEELVEGGHVDADELDVAVTGVASGDALGTALALGDLGGDGYADLVACAPGADDAGAGAGTCWVIGGGAGEDRDDSRGAPVDTVADAAIVGAAARDALGASPRAIAIGDVDGDGRAELVLGAPGHDGGAADGGAVWVYAGADLDGAVSPASATWSLVGDGALGAAVRLGDVTGDGAVDLLAGATTAGGGAGAVYVFAGGGAPGAYTLPGAAAASWTGEAAGDAFGAAISGVWDLDDDGRAELAVAAPGSDVGATDAGTVYVLPVAR